MKALSKYIDEKLVINKSFKNANEIDNIINVGWYTDNGYYGTCNREAYDIYCDYISLGEKIKNVDELRTAIQAAKHYNADKICFGAFNKTVLESIVFCYKKEDNLYDKISMFLADKYDNGNCFIYNNNNVTESEINPFKTNAQFCKTGQIEIFLISIEMYDDVVKMFNTIKKSAITKSEYVKTNPIY